MLSLLACVTASVLWAASYRNFPSLAWKGATHTTHGTVQRGIVWFTRVGGWPPQEEMAVSSSARPVVVIPQFKLISEEIYADRSAALLTAQVLERKDPSNPGIAKAQQRATSLKTGMHNYAVTLAGGSPAEPIIAEKAPELWQASGITLDRGAARFPERETDGSINYGPAVAYTAFGLPCWMLISVFGAAPILMGLRAVRRLRVLKVRRREGQCPKCGYDLRATQQRCPECGTEPGIT